MDFENYRQNQQKSVREWLQRNISLANNIENEAFSEILLLSIIDCFAQANSGYDVHHTSRAFCDFILTFSSSQNNVLQYVCPVTLGYDYNLTPSLINGMIYEIDDLSLAKEGERLLQMIPENKRDKARHKHQYVGLLYATRNKLVHEINTLGHHIDFLNGKPSVAKGRTINYVDDEKVEVEEWGLYFPKKYIYDLAIETVYAYVNHCDSEKKLIAPIETRKSRYAWYD